MNNATRVFRVTTLALAITCGSAKADPGETHKQVQADSIAVQQDGDTIMGFSGKTQRELFPGNYPATTTGVGKTREQVKAELAAAIKSGDIIVGDFSYSLRELFPSQYPAVATGPAKTREQVKAEFAVAQQSGDIVTSFAAKTERELSAGFVEKSRLAASPSYALVQTSGKTRAQVYAELVAAKKAGDVGIGEDSLTERERFPQLYRSNVVQRDVADGGSVSAAD
jgi:hypothetical protein